MVLGLVTLICVHISAALAQGQDGTGNGGYSVTEQSQGGGSGRPLVFSTILFEPYLMESEDRRAMGNDRFVGFIPDLVKELADRLEFEYELRLVKDNKWGARDQSTGKWNGMIGEVIRGEADFAAAPLTVTDMRKSVVDFTSVIQEVSVTALVRAGSNLYSLDDVLRSNLTYGTIRGGSTAKALMGSRDPQVNKLWSRIVSHNGMVENSRAGREKAKAGGYAFILEEPIGEYYVAQDCSLETTGEFFPLSGFAFPARKYYPDMARVNQALSEIKREGKIEALLEKWWAPLPCSASRGVVISSALLLLSTVFSLLW